MALRRCVTERGVTHLRSENLFPYVSTNITLRWSGLSLVDVDFLPILCSDGSNYILASYWHSDQLNSFSFNDELINLFNVNPCITIENITIK
ncbi:MAG: hypothetical protein JWR09_1126 [Mucilaginibacter sp.]|nr:hypothetical protein [Mucilaginibacter sp.]